MIVKQMADMLNETIKPEVIGTNAEIKFENYDWVDVGIFTTTPAEPEPEPEPVVTPYAEWEIPTSATFVYDGDHISNIINPATTYYATLTPGYATEEDPEIVASTVNMAELDEDWNYKLRNYGYIRIVTPQEQQVEARAQIDTRFRVADSTVSYSILKSGFYSNSELFDAFVSFVAVGNRLVFKYHLDGTNQTASEYDSTVTENSYHEYSVNLPNYTKMSVGFRILSDSIEAFTINSFQVRTVLAKWSRTDTHPLNRHVIGNDTYYVQNISESYTDPYKQFAIDYID